MIKRQNGFRTKKLTREEREQQQQMKEETLKRQLRVQGSPRKSFEQRERILYTPMKMNQCTCGYKYDAHRPDAYERAYLDFVNLREKYDFRYQDEHDEWQRRQLEALNNIERRQLELRLKIEQDNTLRHLQGIRAPPELSDEEAEEILNCPVHIIQERSGSTSPHIEPPLYNPEKAELFRQSTESPERLLIGETSTEHREKLRQERQREYNDMMAQKQRLARNELPPKPGTPGGFLNKLGSHDKQRQKLQEERQKEYKRLQAEKLGLHDFDDPRVLRGEEPPGAPRRGWGTPTYEEMLDKKRNEEQRYRRLNDPEYSRPGLKAYNSEGALHRLENELPGRGVRQHVYHDYPAKPIRDAPTYLPEANKHRFYATLPVGEKESAVEVQKRKDAYRTELENQMQETDAARKRNKNAPTPEDRRPQQAPNPIQPNSMQPNPMQPQVIIIPGAQRPPEVQVIRDGGQQPYPAIPGVDRLSPRSEMLLGRTRDLERLQRRLAKIEQQQNGISQLDLAELDFISKRDPRKQTYQAGMGTTGILEQGFDTLLEAPKMGSVKAPTGLVYEPSTYVTGGENFDKFSTIDQAYHYLGSRNPLDIPVAAAPTGNYGVPQAPSGGVVVDNYRAMGGGGGGGGGGYVSPTYGIQQVRGTGGSGVDEGMDPEIKAKQRAHAQQYQRQLEKQIEDKNYTKAVKREEQERYERKLEDDIRNYNPYGRGGGGAPMKDASGNIVADLRALQKGYTSPRYNEPYTSPRNIARPASPKDDLIKTPPAQTTTMGDNTYARGGHGIFGNPKTEAEKSQADRYKDELQRQIEKKKRDADVEKEKERREEEKQNRILDEQRRKMQEEYDEEKKRVMAKEEETRQRNAEIIKIQGDRRNEEEQLKDELENKKREEARIDYERERLAREFTHRNDSPLIPTLRHKMNGTYNHNDVGPRSNSADVLNQLAHMRRQLQSERKRVETMLEETMNEPEVYDPRLNRDVVPVQQTHPRTDIFNTAVSRNAVHVRRAPTTDHANPQVLQDFDQLKHKDNTDSRKYFRQMYPHDPRTQSELESQQGAFLRQQDDRLKYGGSSSVTDIGNNSSSPQAMLHSQSAFIDVEGMDRNLFPDDFEDFPKRNDSARQRRREREQSDRYPSKSPRDPGMPRHYNPMGSVTSLDVDQISRKNEDRLKRLREIQGDDVSLYDPDDVLNRFMAKQSHNSHFEADDISRIITP